MNLPTFACSLVSTTGARLATDVTWQAVRWSLNRGAIDHSPEDQDD